MRVFTAALCGQGAPDKGNVPPRAPRRHEGNNKMAPGQLGAPLGASQPELVEGQEKPLRQMIGIRLVRHRDFRPGIESDVTGASWVKRNRRPVVAHVRRTVAHSFGTSDRTGSGLSRVQLLPPLSRLVRLACLFVEAHEGVKSVRHASGPDTFGYSVFVPPQPRIACSPLASPSCLERGSQAACPPAPTCVPGPDAYEFQPHPGRPRPWGLSQRCLFLRGDRHLYCISEPAHGGEGRAE